jgi:hypothetical protein
MRATSEIEKVPIRVVATALCICLFRYPCRVGSTTSLLCRVGGRVEVFAASLSFYHYAGSQSLRLPARATRVAADARLNESGSIGLLRSTGGERVVVGVAARGA